MGKMVDCLNMFSSWPAAIQQACVYAYSESELGVAIRPSDEVTVATVSAAVPLPGECGLFELDPDDESLLVACAPVAMSGPTKKPKRKNKRWSLADLREITAMLDSSVHLEEIASRFKCSLGAVNTKRSEYLNGEMAERIALLEAREKPGDSATEVAADDDQRERDLRAAVEAMKARGFSESRIRVAKQGDGLKWLLGNLRRSTGEDPLLDQVIEDEFRSVERLSEEEIAHIESKWASNGIRRRGV